MFLFNVIADGIGRENATIISQNEVYQALKQTFFPYLVSSDYIVKTMVSFKSFKYLFCASGESNSKRF